MRIIRQYFENYTPVAGIATGIAQSIARKVKKMAIIEGIKTKTPIKIGEWLTIGEDGYIKPIEDSSEFRGYIFGVALESTPKNMQEGDLVEIRVQTDGALALGDRRDSGEPKVIMGNGVFTDDETNFQPFKKKETPEEAIKRMRNMKRSLIF